MNFVIINYRLFIVTINVMSLVFAVHFLHTYTIATNNTSKVHISQTLPIVTNFPVDVKVFSLLILGLRRILHAPNRVAQLNACKIRRLN